MLVDDRVELQYANTAAIDTSGYRLSPELCGHALNSRERSGSVYDKKPTPIRSRVSQKEHYHPWMCSLMHNPCSGGYTTC